MSLSASKQAVVIAIRAFAQKKSKPVIFASFK